VFERWTAVEANTRDAGDREFDNQHITRFSGRVVAGRTVGGAHRALRKGFGVEASSGLGVLIVPETDRVQCHCESFDV